MYEYIHSFGYDGRVILTKIDKLNQSQIIKAKRDIAKGLHISEDHVFLISNLKAKGKYPLWDYVDKLFKDKGYEIKLERQHG